MRLESSLVLVTGASSGIGRATAVRLAGCGSRLLLTGRDPVRLDEVAAAAGGIALPADLSDPAQARSLASRVLEVGVPDILLHSAGIGLARRLSGEPGDEHSADDFARLLAVNAQAPAQLSAALLPAMTQRGSGRLVFVTSIAAMLGVPDESLYAASKAAMQVLADSLRGELAGTGVGVTTVVPGVVDTAFFARRGRDYERRFPRPIRADRVADAIVSALRRDRNQVIVPAWLRAPIAVRACAPEWYVRLSGRFG